MQTITLAPTPAVETAKTLAPTNEVKVVRMNPVEPPGMSKRATEEPISPEKMREFRARQRQFAQKTIELQLQKTDKAIEDLSNQLQAVEARARRSNSSVIAAAEALDKARNDYERERYALPGMTELKRDRDAAKARLAELKGKDGQQDAELAVKEELKKLTHKMYETEMVGRTNSLALQQTLDGFRGAEIAYGASLQSLSEFKQLDAKYADLLKKRETILESQSAFGREEK